jgi:protein-disulfide isomerase
MKTNRLFLVIICLLAIGIGIGLFISLKQPSFVNPTSLIGQSTPTRGRETATFSLVEFGNYESPDCAAYISIINELASDFDSQLTIAYHQVSLPQYPKGNLAAYAAEAARLQDKFWEYSNALFIHQSELGPDLYQHLAVQYDLDLNIFNRNLTDANVKQKIADDTKLAKQVGASKLPVFFFNGKRLPQMTPQQLKTYVSDLIPKPTPPLEPTATPNFTPL